MALLSQHPDFHISQSLVPIHDNEIKIADKKKKKKKKNIGMDDSSHGHFGDCHMT